MRHFLTFILALAVLIACVSCNTSSGRRAKNPVPYSVDALLVQYDTTKFTKVNDTIAYAKLQRVWMRKINKRFVEIR